MPKLYRLSRADFTSLRTLRKEHGSFFTLTISKSPDNKPRFACVVSKKTAHRASARNLIKRRCRAAIRKRPVKVPFAFVFTAKRSANEASYREISDDVTALFVKGIASLKGSSELQ